MTTAGSGVDVIGAVLAAVSIVLTFWFYPHCAHPALAFAGAPRTAFDVVLLCMEGSIAVYSALLADAVLAILPSGSVRPLLACGIGFWLTLSVGFLRPSWFTRLGGRDSTAPVRFLLTWLRKEWPQLDNVSRQGPSLLRLTEVELEKVREPANAALVDEWVVSFETYLRKSRQGPVSAQSAEQHLVERLASVHPVDRLARVF